VEGSDFTSQCAIENVYWLIGLLGYFV